MVHTFYKVYILKLTVSMRNVTVGSSSLAYSLGNGNGLVVKVILPLKSINFNKLSW